MNAVHRKLAIVAAIGAALLLLAGPALGSEPVIEEVIVKAPQVYRTQDVDVSESGVRTEWVGLQRSVSYADLDLERPEDVVQMGDEIKVRCINVDPSGKVKVSRKAIVREEKGLPPETSSSGGDRGGRGGRGGRRGGDRGGNRGGGRGRRERR